MGFLSLILLTLLSLAGCISDPAAPPVTTPPAATHGVIVVNEGVWRQDNATLTFFDPATGQATQDYFALRNPGLHLGDVANSMQSWNGKGYIAVSTSRTVEVIELASGRSLGRVRMPERNEPRAVAIVDSATAFASCFGDSVVRFNPTTLVAERTIAVGPAPEGIAWVAGKLLVANSGYGFYRQGEAKAGTISVIDPATDAETRSFFIGPNPRQIRYLPSRGALYILYGLPDSTGGIVELDPISLAERRRWELRGAVDLVVDETRDIGYAIGSDGVVAIDFSAADPRPSLLVPGAAWPRVTFYSLGIVPGGDSIYLGTYSYFTLPGEVLIFNRAGTLTGRFPTGLGPGDIGFY